MKIDGYIPVDQKIALDQGVTFDYELDFGTITIRSRTLSMADNPKFAMAFTQHQKWMERRQNLSSKLSDKEAEERFLGMLFDHGVIAWETSIKSDGKAIEPTRENFIELMRTPACRKVAVVYMQDAGDDANFRPAEKQDDVGNSGPPSDMKSSGAASERNSSEA